MKKGLVLIALILVSVLCAQESEVTINDTTAVVEEIPTPVQLPELEDGAVSENVDTETSPEEENGKSARELENERIVWEVGLGGRMNLLGLTGGFEVYNATHDQTSKVDYKDIGMDNIEPSFAIAAGGRYKLLNLAFGGSRGTYEGSFVTQQPIYDPNEDTLVIDSGETVDGYLSMGIYSLSTTVSFLRKKHDLGAGIGFLILGMSSEYSSEGVKIIGDKNETDVYPMPFLAMSGRLNFNRLHLAAVGGGAYFSGEKDGLDYTVWYYNLEARASYDVFKKGNWSGNVAAGYRTMVMDMDMEKNSSWAKEKDLYRGAFLGFRVKFSRFSDDPEWIKYQEKKAAKKAAKKEKRANKE